MLFASSLFIRWALRPLALAGTALARLESGDYSARVKPSGSPEFVETCLKINSLAGSLSELRAANEELIQRLLDVQDAERKAIAHELHDEIGPHLFALRAKAAVLASRLEKDGLSDATAAAISIRDQIEALQGHNRRILARLRPVALEELGLVEALGALIEQWRNDEPNVTLEFSVDPRVAELGERASLMAYRFVQEALTNAFRHSRARRIEATLAYDGAGAGGAARDPALSGLRIRIEDDGQGMAADATPGMGLVGMRERVKALGGVIAIGDRPAAAWLSRRGSRASSRARRDRADGPYLRINTVIMSSSAKSLFKLLGGLCQPIQGFLRRICGIPKAYSHRKRFFQVFRKQNSETIIDWTPAKCLGPVQKASLTLPLRIPRGRRLDVS